jgi:hypothetical protein
MPSIVISTLGVSSAIADCSAQPIVIIRQTTTRQTNRRFLAIGCSNPDVQSIVVVTSSKAGTDAAAFTCAMLSRKKKPALASDQRLPNRT